MAPPGSIVKGPNGLFRPRSDSFLNCKGNPKICENFQGAHLTKKYPCDRSHKFRCSFEYDYGDDTAVKGSVFLGDASLQLSHGSRLQTRMAFGCADKRVEDVVDDVDWMDNDTVKETIQIMIETMIQMMNQRTIPAKKRRLQMGC